MQGDNMADNTRASGCMRPLASFNIKDDVESSTTRWNYFRGTQAMRERVAERQRREVGEGLQQGGDRLQVKTDRPRQRCKINL